LHSRTITRSPPHFGQRGYAGTHIGSIPDYGFAKSESLSGSKKSSEMEPRQLGKTARASQPLVSAAWACPACTHPADHHFGGGTDGFLDTEAIGAMDLAPTVEPCAATHAMAICATVVPWQLQLPSAPQWLLPIADPNENYLLSNATKSAGLISMVRRIARNVPRSIAE
jgi:hypothetical protein